MVMREELNRTGILIPKLGLGTYGLDHIPKERAISVIRKAIELEMSLIDTAEMYGWGRVEEIVGEAVKPFDREEYFLVSKVWGSNLSYEGVMKAAKSSVRRLGTYIDLYLIHWPNPRFPVEETLRAFKDLKREGVIRFSGVSNFSLRQMLEAMQYDDIVANQVEYHLRQKEPEGGLLQFCQENRITLMAYSPLDRGSLARNPPKVLREVAKELGRTPAQVALRWLISKKMVVAIPKTGSIDHLLENYGSLNFEIPEHLMRKLDSLG